ncbi:hypothetical protein R6Z07F_014211 [Ovis aries]
MPSSPLRVAVVCMSNVNRSMEAHRVLRKNGFHVRSFGAGSHVRLPGGPRQPPVLYDFSTPCKKMHGDLSSKDQKHYQRNGVLRILRRNERIKPGPERFQECPDPFDLIFTCGQRAYNRVVADLCARDQETWQPVPVVNVDIDDTLEAASLGASIICELCQGLQQAGDTQSRLAELLQAAEEKTGRSFLHTVHPHPVKEVEEESKASHRIGECGTPVDMPAPPVRGTMLESREAAAMPSSPLRVAVVCMSNVNRSMEAHRVLRKNGFHVRSFGAGSHVRLPGGPRQPPVLYDFSTPCKKMHGDLSSKDQKHYQRNGVLRILRRNERIKPGPERFQECPDPFDLIFTCGQRAYNRVVADLCARDQETWQPVPVVNVDIDDTLEAASLGASIICELCQGLQQAGDTQSRLAELLQAAEEKTGRSFLHTVCFY